MFLILGLVFSLRDFCLISEIGRNFSVIHHFKRDFVSIMQTFANFLVIFSELANLFRSFKKINSMTYKSRKKSLLFTKTRQNAQPWFNATLAGLTGLPQRWTTFLVGYTFNYLSKGHNNRGITCLNNNPTQHYSGISITPRGHLATINNYLISYSGSITSG